MNTIRCIICHFSPEESHNHILSEYKINDSSKDVITVCPTCKELIKALKKDGRIDTSYVNTGFVYTIQEILIKTSTYLQSSKRRSNKVAQAFGKKLRNNFKELIKKD